MLVWTFTLTGKSRGELIQAYIYLTLLSAVLSQVETQQYSENLEGALPTNSNICNKKIFTAVLMLKKFSVFSQVKKMADCDQLR